jgi:hypothetical protein
MKDGGVRAARLLAIESDIVANLEDRWPYRPSRRNGAADWR